MGGDDTNPALQSSDSEDTIAATLPPLSIGDKPAKGRKGRQAGAAQAEPTAPRAVDPDTGLELDEHGLPLSGPARRRWLADAGIEDPALTIGAPETEKPNG